MNQAIPGSLVPRPGHDPTVPGVTGEPRRLVGLGKPGAVAAKPGTDPDYWAWTGLPDYAEQNERDHKSLVDAVASGRITAERDT